MAGHYDDYGYEDEYYEDEYYEDEYYDEEFIDEEEMEQNLKNKVILTMSSSYGISALFHIVLLIIFASYYLAQKEEVKEAVVLAKREIKEQDYDEKLKRDMEKRPEIKAEEMVEKPIVELEEEYVETEDIPKGTSMSNLSNKNLDSTSVVDAFGIGGGAAGAYGQRWGKGRLSRYGGSVGTESAVEAALRWLKRHQSPDGSWDTDGFHRNCKEGQCSGPDFNDPSGRGPGIGFEWYDVGVTSLALLAYLGSGHTHRFGKYKNVVRKGLTFLKKRQKPSGNMGYTESHGESIYNHAIATMAICEAYAVSRDFTLKRYAEKAVKFALDAQNPKYGWRYGVQPGKNDTSVTGWMVLALKAAATAKKADKNFRDVPRDVFDGAINWFDRVTAGNGVVGYKKRNDGGSLLAETDENGNPLYTNRPGFKAVPTMTSVAVISRIFLGQKKTEPSVKKGVDILMKMLPKWGEEGGKSTVNMYYWYYGTYALFQAGSRSEWKKWNEAMQKALLETQRKGGDEDGSWDPVGDWGVAGGRVYTTAIGALTLEIYYRYAKVGEK